MVFLERVRFLSAVSLWKAEEVVHATCRFLALSYTFTSADQYYHPLSVDTTIMLSNKCLIIRENVMVVFLT